MRSPIRTAIVSAALLGGLAFTAPAAAYPGDLDPDFGRFGKGTTVLGSASDLAVQPDGRIVVAGSGLDFATFGTLIRYAADGGIDQSFANHGFAGLVPQGTLHSVAALPDGRLLAAGVRFADPRSIVLVRTLGDGTPDPSFGGDGVVEVGPADAQGDVAAAVAPNGAIALAMSSAAGLTVTRLLADGTPDPGSFGGAPLAFAFGPSATPAVAVAADGGVVAAATVGDHGVIVRTTATGTADPAFSGDGVVELPSGTAVRAIAVDAQGGVVVAGSGSDLPAAVRLTSAGAPDAGFAGDGRFEGREGAFEDLAIQPDGRIVLVGKEYSVTRLLGDGTPDPGFGRDGVARTSMPGDTATATAVALQTDGRIAVAGVASSFSFRGETRSIAPARYLNGGSKRDADADGFADRRDRCRYDPSRRHRGCPFVRRGISLKQTRGGFGGKVSVFGPSRCVRDSKVALLRKRPGTDRRVARTRVRRGRKYRFRVHRPHGTYYAVAKAKVVFGIGLCASARSRKLTAGP